jgi:hypothetical protein
MEKSNPDRGDVMASAAGHLQAALQLLDFAEAPAQIAAHIDLALHQLQSEILDRPGSGPRPTLPGAAPH